jgi:hypothetical protein
LNSTIFAGQYLDIDGIDDPYSGDLRGTMCALRITGDIVCFCSQNDCSYLPTSLTGGPYQSVSVGYNTVCGILADGNYCSLIGLLELI